MRWQPPTPTCSECGFDWNCDNRQAVAIVAQASDDAAGAIRLVTDPKARTAERWSASMYVWHLVDVLRIGTERLLTLLLDSASGIPCWDEDELAAARRYAELSPMVGLAVMERAASEWVEVALTVPHEAETEHPQFGPIGVAEVMRRNAHEVQHHILDIQRWDGGLP